jgi:hypothetical protein
LVERTQTLDQISINAPLRAERSEALSKYSNEECFVGPTCGDSSQRPDKFDHRGKAMKRYWTGIILIVVGVMFPLDSMNIIQFDEIIHKYWPLGLILIGVIILLKEHAKP